jgi:hypothetical protein
VVRVTAATSPGAGRIQFEHPSQQVKDAGGGAPAEDPQPSRPNLEQAAFSTYRDILRAAYATPAPPAAKIQCRKGNLDRDGDWWPAAIARHLRGRSRKTSPDTSSADGPPTAASRALTELATPPRSL